MTQVGYGVPWRIDGPPPKAPLYNLLGVATVIDDLDAEGVPRWANGVTVYPYPKDLGEVWDTCNHGSGVKVAGLAVPKPDFGAYTMYVAETCSSFGIFGEGMSNAEAQARFVARANATTAAVESAAIESEFMNGAVMGNNPHLADGMGTIDSTVRNVVTSFALLENLIGETGRQGVIHCSPACVTVAASKRVVFPADRDGVIRTINGTPVIPGYGYIGNSKPAGIGPSPGATQEYVYATGPIEVRRSQMVILPGDLSQALDRATNTITYRVERDYVVDWDTVLQVGQLVDWSL